MSKLTTSARVRYELRAKSDMKNKKAPGRDGITVELLKADNIITESILEELFKVIWDTEEYRAVEQKELLQNYQRKET